VGLVSAIPSQRVVSQPFAPRRNPFKVGWPRKVRARFQAGAGQAVVGGLGKFEVPLPWPVSAPVPGWSGFLGWRWFGAGFVAGRSAGCFGLRGVSGKGPISDFPV
jgi:hypothetical protein